MQGKAAAIIVAAGQGSRAGGALPKQFAILGGLPVLAHSARALTEHPAIGQVFVVIGEGQENWARAALSSLAVAPTLVTGGATRQLSVQAGLSAVRANGRCYRVLIHDAARPFLHPAVIDRLLNALEHDKGAIPVLPVVDTLARGANAVLGDGVDRDRLYRVQTPQAFHLDVIWAAHHAGSTMDATDDAGLVRSLGHAVALVEGDSALEKLTHPADFARAQAQLSARLMPRTGMGYDVHRLVEGKPLWLGGVEIPHDRGLSGHSDADVALHALVDALLGALAEGDIGTHFPPSDPQWRGAASHRFLSFARERVEARGGRITHVDLTIICEAPKIGPHRDAIRTRIAELLALSPDRVSVKATTTEQLGFTGRAEGIAAHAIATILLPDL
ncbi:bifunctional 2-C-methyl-D-erythritol 4-phosphate cytidylyltransferase/2-C-methyl-D-erythritol 2,4-cyclodiphosphate synthase [Sphingobium subterraneum]|uniref:Bifunctional enzyme IspD/IspF n=1 Tax=Sphingobium subterraneum TaxID=627688 RepID=A0A841J1M0_9SPHN|nr:bifunctional 2-C-methyl-D-erythritol 4-phosphate cytidylyltransferase/2-C-methyl-D-erythritol 2,4-cyclodiphosphate synthase [Sphingobium subterraneum]MBB6122555.1 2-C-methyl-D-erythritol 4-phosphate cytidylyltransferase/2-C-methyl-D-erythritol 2,4-cyclodiphosphate synthase [Sphingobium subterraneum]